MNAVYVLLSLRNSNNRSWVNSQRVDSNDVPYDECMKVDTSSSSYSVIEYLRGRINVRYS